MRTLFLTTFLLGLLCQLCSSLVLPIGRPCLGLDNSLSSKPLVKTVAMKIKAVKPNTFQAL
ncbi:hypothetical protein CLU79DRAFT_886909, partial [Phycomyces nitens]